MEQSCLNCCTVHPSHFVSLKKVLTVTHKLFKYRYTTNTTPGTVEEANFGHISQKNKL